MSSDEDFDGAAYKEFEDQLYQEESLSGSEDDLGSEVEEALYSQVHYASSLFVSESSTSDDQRTPKKTNLENDGLQTKGRQKCHLDNTVIEISSDNDDDDDDDDDDDVDSKDDTDDDSVEDVEVCSNSLEYPEVINIFSSDENDSTSVGKARTEMPLVQNTEEPGEITENWDLNERDLEHSTVTKQRTRYYTPGKGLPHVRCYNCNEKGHLSQYCPEPKKISVCFLCGGAGHLKRNCPNELCFNCHEPGHQSKQCRKPRTRPFDRCKRCHVLGHLANDCPDRWRQYHLTTQVGPIICPDRPTSPPRSVYCYNCGCQGHYGHECQEENSLWKGELPLPFVVRYDGHPVSSFRGEKNDNNRKEARRPRNDMQLQHEPEGSYNQSRQDYDMDRTLFQPPPEKVQILSDSDDIRRGDSYQTSEVNTPYYDRILPKRKNKKKRKKKYETATSTERIVEFVDPSIQDEGLVEEPYQTKRKKNKKRKHWQTEDTFDDNSYSNNDNFNGRKKLKQGNNSQYTNPHHKKDFRSFGQKDVDARRTSFNPKRGRKDFVSNRGFRFNNQTRGKKSNPQFLKRYTF